MKASITGRQLALAWVLALTVSTVLALRTFKTTLVSDGMAADQALLRASVWEAVHLFIIVGLVPACVVLATWAYLRSSRVADWTGKRILVVWLSVPGAFYLCGLIEGMMTETILPLDGCCVLPFAYGVRFILTAAAMVLTLYWVRNGRAYRVGPTVAADESTDRQASDADRRD
jgi:hypothetical protein